MSDARNVRRASALILTASISLLLLAGGAAAEVALDFESGMPTDVKLTSRSGTMELETNGDNTVLELGKNALVTLGEKKYLNFTLEATVRREYDSSGSHIGFQFRNGYRVYLRKPGRVELTGPNRARGRGFTRNRVTHKPLKLKIVVAGPVVRFFIDGRYEGQFDHLELTPGPIALYQRGVQHNAYVDNVKLSTNMEPSQLLACEPVPKADNALVFDPSEDVKFQLKVTNHHDRPQKAKVGLTLSTFDDKPVYTGASAAAVIGPGETKTVTANLGRIPEGFYRLTFLATGKTFPLAVHVKGTVTEDQIKMPKIMTGVYWYYFGFQGLPELWWNTYMHAACNDLRKHHFNTIICAIGMPTESIAIAGQYGIRCFTRGQGIKGNVAHPNVIGGFIGDEPHKGDEARYIKLYTQMVEKYPDKVWTTCMIGDGGVLNCEKWWDAWQPLSKNSNVVRMLRWYGIKKFSVGIKRTYSMLPPLTEMLRDLSQGKGPYYFIMPSFGSQSGIKAYFSDPLPSQIRCMMHLAAAYQAKGLFFWTYQTPFPDHDAFVDPATLMPLDGKWAAAGQAAGAIQKNADLLAECTWKGRYPFVDGPSLLEAFELKRKGDPATYFYVINKDTEHSAKGRLFNLAADSTLRDLFNDRNVPVAESTVQLMRPDQRATTPTALISLLPGDGILLKYDEKSQQADKALPRVKYPKNVANAPKGKITWLSGVRPIGMPVPGWYPLIKFKGKTWYPDYNSKDIKLYSGPKDSGQLYKNSLWAHAETTIKYKLPQGAVTFAAAAGFAGQNKRSSAIFRVLVDGKEKYNSGVMTVNSKVQAVVVDVRGGRFLELITEEAGDGLYGDYTFWGEARLISK